MPYMVWCQESTGWWGYGNIEGNLRAICGYGHFLSDPLARVSLPLQSKKAGLFLHEFAVNDTCSSALRVFLTCVFERICSYLGLSAEICSHSAPKSISGAAS